MASTSAAGEQRSSSSSYSSLEVVLEYLESKSPPKSQLFSKAGSELSWNCSMKNKEIRTALSNVSNSVVAVAVFNLVDKNCTLSCSGLVIGWDETNSEGTILTTTRLLRFPQGYFSRKRFKLVVRLKDGTLLPATEEFIDFYHNVMTITVSHDKELKAVNLENVDVTQGLNVISVGRDFLDCSTKASIGELLLEYPYFGCQELLKSTCEDSRVNEGGPLITTRGNILGINLSYDQGHACPLPTSVILKCLKKWKSNRLVMRPWLGIDVIDSDQLPVSAWEKLDITPHESCLVVLKVYEESPAYDNGLCPGDCVISCLDHKILSAQQFADVLDNLSYKWKGRRSITFGIRRLEDKETVQIDAEMIGVNDRRFSSCWPRDRDLWLQPPPDSYCPPEPMIEPRHWAY